MSTYTAEQLQEIVRKHGAWLRSEKGGERANLRNANLRNADLRAADLSNANLSSADLSSADLRSANLEGITVSWNAHALLSEILYRASGKDLGRQALSSMIGRNTRWCWAVWTNDDAPKGVDQDDWLGIVVDHREWALSELAKWVKDGDGAPDAVRQYAKTEVTA